MDVDNTTVPTASHEMLKSTTSGQRNVITNGAVVRGTAKNPRNRSKSESVEHIGVVVKSSKDKNQDRKPRNLKGTGKPKKEGGGGKGTWGKDGQVYEEVKEEDPSDPNYDSEGDKRGDIVMQEVEPDLKSSEFDKVFIPMIKEYYDHEISAEVAASLSELNIIHLKHRIVFLLVSMAMEKKNLQREKTSMLISDLYGEHILMEQDVELGFQAVLNNLKDLLLDTPDAADVCGMFIARCIADDCLNPSFITEHLQHPTEVQRKALVKAQSYLKMKHGLVRLDNVWGYGGGSKPVKRLIKEIVLMVKEYLSSNDIAEAERCVHDLDVPHFHHEIVYEAVQACLEDGSDRVNRLITKFLKHFYDNGVLSLDQVNSGFQRIFQNMDDIILDCPRAYKHLDQVVNSCTRAGVITMSLRQKAPTRARKRFMSEGDKAFSTNSYLP